MYSSSNDITTPIIHFVQQLSSAILLLLLCMWFGYFVVVLAGLWMVCGLFDWFVGGLADLCVVWLI